MKIFYKIKMARLAGTRDANLLILDKMDDRTLLSYCQTNRYSKNLCNNEDFWRNRFIKVYGIENAKLKNKNRTWKNYYLLVTYYTNKYTDKKALMKVAEKGYMDLFNLFSKGMLENEINKAVVLSGNKELIYNIQAPSYLLDAGLIVAARRGDLELVNFYLSRDANPYMITIGALEGNHIDLFQQSKIQKISPNNGLRYSAYSGNYDLVNFFIDQGATDFNGALEYAALTGQKEMINYLIRKGANDFQIALEAAAEGGYIDLIDYFISKGATITYLAEVRAETGGHKEVISYINKLKK